MTDGIKIYYKEEIQIEAPPLFQFSTFVPQSKRPQKPKKPEKNSVDKFFLEYSIKGTNPDFLMRTLRNTAQYKHWMLNIKQSDIAS